MPPNASCAWSVCGTALKRPFDMTCLQESLMDLKIRKMDIDDLEPLYMLLSNAQVMRFLEPPFSRDRTERFLAEAGLSDPPLILAAEAYGLFIGYVIFHDYDDESSEIGWVLLPEYWGRGFASCLTEMLIERGRQLNRQLVIECDPEQKVTRHIALKYGFLYEGREDGLDIYRLDINRPSLQANQGEAQ